MSVAIERPVDLSAARLRRRDRYRRRDLVHEVGEQRRTRFCGRYLNGQTYEGAAVEVVVGPNGASYRGVSYCGSVWACAYCAPVIRSTRADELERAVSLHLFAGGSLVFVTLTVPHRRRDSLADSYQRVREGWSAFKRNRAGRDALSELGVIGSVSAAEVTHGRHGWHPHLHLLLFLAGAPSEDRLDDFRGKLRAEWDKTAQRRSWGRRPDYDHGADVQLVKSERDAARYIAKVQGEDLKDHPVTLELTRGDLKAGRRVAQLTPFEILDRYQEARTVKGHRGGRRWVGMWREYEAAMKGKRCIVWSKGLREHFGMLEAELSDEQIVNETHEDGAEALSTPVDYFTWRLVILYRLRAQLLDAVEKRGELGLRAFLVAVRDRWDASEDKPVEFEWPADDGSPQAWLDHGEDDE